MSPYRGQSVGRVQCMIPGEDLQAKIRTSVWNMLPSSVVKDSIVTVPDVHNVQMFGLTMGRTFPPFLDNLCLPSVRVQ
eukprot:11205250-Karenia_brevis.AAC.1